MAGCFWGLPPPPPPARLSNSHANWHSGCILAFSVPMHTGYTTACMRGKRLFWFCSCNAVRQFKCNIWASNWAISTILGMGCSCVSILLWYNSNTWQYSQYYPKFNNHSPLTSHHTLQSLTEREIISGFQFILCLSVCHFCHSVSLSVCLSVWWSIETRSIQSWQSIHWLVCSWTKSPRPRHHVYYPSTRTTPLLTADRPRAGCPQRIEYLWRSHDDMGLYPDFRASR